MGLSFFKMYCISFSWTFPIFCKNSMFYDETEISKYQSAKVPKKVALKWTIYASRLADFKLEVAFNLKCPLEVITYPFKR